jgi:hypothetical protein
VVKGLNSLNGCEKRTIRIEFLNLAKENLNTRHVVTHRVTRATFPLSSRVVDQGNLNTSRGSMQYQPVDGVVLGVWKQVSCSKLDIVLVGNQ